MEAILDQTIGRGEVRLRRQAAGVILTLLLGLSVARADFTGDFAAAFWTNAPSGSGSVAFSNSFTELVLQGPAPATGSPGVIQSSLDGILYNGPLPGGLKVGGTVQFDWNYYSPGDASDDEADFLYWAPGGSTNLTQLGFGPSAGTVGNLPPIHLPEGSAFQFVLFTSTYPGKDAGSLVITGFQFNPDVAPRLTAATVSNGVMVITWSGGKPPYQLEKQSALLPGAPWEPLGSPVTGTSATVPITGPGGFIRVRCGL